MDEPELRLLNLTHASSTSAIIRVDTRDLNTTTGRRSVRVESKKQYDTGLFIFDVKHTPVGCSTWSMLSMKDRYSWPQNGEIDIVEAGNSAIVRSQVTLHTSDGCSMKRIRREQSGTTITNDCFSGSNNNSGCGVLKPRASYGQLFNENEGVSMLSRSVKTVSEFGFGHDMLSLKMCKSLWLVVMLLQTHLHGDVPLRTSQTRDVRSRNTFEI